MNIGDIVRLKSSGPDMTACGLVEDGTGKVKSRVWTCMWFHPNTVSGELNWHKQDFPEDALELVKTNP